MWSFLAGTGIFLLGSRMMEDALMRGSIQTLKRLLKTYTDKAWKAVCSGFIVASITQSSTIVSVMTVAFVGAGVMSLISGVGVIIGANIGSTTLGLVFGSAIGGSFKLSVLAMPMLAIGGIGELFFRKKKVIYMITRIIFSFGLIFFGIGMIKDVISSYALGIDMSIINQGGIFGYFLIGLVLTALMHSSDGMLIIALAFLAQGVITFPEGIAIIIGANIGTTVSAIEGSLSGSAEQKQVALSHFFFNLISAAFGLPLIYPAIAMLSNFFVLPEQNVIALAVFDVIFNLVGALIFYPFIPQFVKFLKFFVRQKEPEFVLHSPHIHMENIEKALAAFAVDIELLFKKVYMLNAKEMSIDTQVLSDPHATLETKYGAIIKVDNENIEQDYKVILTIEETLMQTGIKINQKHKFAHTEHMNLFILREAIERIVYSAKALYDTKEIIDDLRGARLPLIDQYLHTFTKEMIDLYVIIGSFLSGTETPAQRKHLQKYLLDIANADEKFLNALGDKLPQELLSSRQLTSLTHVRQGLNRSHKAMLHTVDILFPDKME